MLEPFDGAEYTMEGAVLCLTGSGFQSEFYADDFSQHIKADLLSDPAAGAELAILVPREDGAELFLQVGGNLEGTPAADAASIEYEQAGNAVTGTATMIDTDTRFAPEPTTARVEFALAC